MPDKPKYYLTTPIYYTNGLPHIGHTYSTIVCDTIRRYKRMRGYEVVMTTGTDEHGVNVERSAKKAGVPESEFVAKMAAEWRALWDELGVQGDEFIRTTDLKHAHTVQWLFKQCRDNGFVYPAHFGSLGHSRSRRGAACFLCMVRRAHRLSQRRRRPAV